MPAQDGSAGASPSQESVLKRPLVAPSGADFQVAELAKTQPVRCAPRKARRALLLRMKLLAGCDDCGVKGQWMLLLVPNQRRKETLTQEAARD